MADDAAAPEFREARGLGLTPQRHAPGLFGLIVQILPDARGIHSPPGRGADPDSANTVPGYYKVGFQYDAESFGLPRDRFTAAVRAEGIALSEGFAAQHVGRSPQRYRRGSDLTESELAHHGVVILHHPVLLGGAGDLAEVAAAVGKVYTHREALR